MDIQYIEINVTFSVLFDDSDEKIYEFHLMFLTFIHIYTAIFILINPKIKKKHSPKCFNIILRFRITSSRYKILFEPMLNSLSPIAIFLATGNTVKKLKNIFLRNRKIDVYRNLEFHAESEINPTFGITRIIVPL